MRGNSLLTVMLTAVEPKIILDIYIRSFPCYTLYGAVIRLCSDSYARAKSAMNICIQCTGVLSSHAVLGAQISSLLQAWRWTAEDHCLNTLPLHHTHGATLCSSISSHYFNHLTVSFSISHSRYKPIDRFYFIISIIISTKKKMFSKLSSRFKRSWSQFWRKSWLFVDIILLQALSTLFVVHCGSAPRSAHPK